MISLTCKKKVKCSRYKISEKEISLELTARVTGFNKNLSHLVILFFAKLY